MQVGQLDSFVANEVASNIEAVLTNYQFPWYWRPATTHSIHTNSDNRKDFQFIHLMYYGGEPQSEFFGLTQEVLTAFEKATKYTIKKLCKVKANLLVRQYLTQTELSSTIHTDLDDLDKKYMSIVYYVTDSDGDTVVYDKNNNVLISKNPVKGSAIYFPSCTFHRATPPIINKRRIVLNIVVEIE